MSATHIKTLVALRLIQDSLEPTSELFWAQQEAIDLFRQEYKFELQNDLTEVTNGRL